MDGELWAGRGQFQKAVSNVRQQDPSDAAKRGIQFMVFDLPAEPGIFTERLTTLINTAGKLAMPRVQAVAQSKVASNAALQNQFRQITKGGAEGLMLHRGSSLYKGVLNDDLRKVKTHDDAEAKVTGYTPAKTSSRSNWGRWWSKLLLLKTMLPIGLSWIQGSVKHSGRTRQR